MAILDKILFWRHKERPLGQPSELGLGKEKELGLNLEEPGIGAGPMPRSIPNEEPITANAPTMNPPGINQTAPAFSPAPPSVNKDIELISAKLDSLKAMLDNINQRLANLERIARGGI